MSNLYRAYSAVHSSEVSDQLNESRDLISDMQFNQLNSSDLQEVAEEILEEMFELSLDIEQSSDIIADILSESLKTSQSDLKSQKIDYIGEAFDAALENGHTVERFLGYRRSKKVQENFHNTSNEDRSSKRLHEALIAQERKNIKEGILSLIEKKTKDSSYLETNMKKRAENNEKARKDMEKMGSMKNPQLEEFSQIRQDWSSAYSSIYEKKMDAVGKEDGDIDNDGDEDSSDDYLANRRKAIGKSMSKKGTKKKNGKEVPNCVKEGEVLEGMNAIRADAGPPKTTMRMSASGQEPAGDKLLRKVSQGFSNFMNRRNPKAMQSKPAGPQRKPLISTPKEEVEEYIDFLITEGYDCSDLTWNDMYEEYQSLDEGLRSAVKRLLGGKKKEEPAKPMSRGDELRKKYNVGPERSDTSAKAQILKKTRARAERDQKEFGGSRYSKGVADRSKAAYKRQLEGGYSKYGANDARGSGNKARKRAAALTKEELEQIEEDSRRTSNKQHTARVKSNIKSFGSDYTPPSNYDPDANRGKGEVLTRKQVEKKRRKSLRKEELEATGLFTVKEIEGMSEEYLDEAQMARNNPEKYERDSRKSETSGQKAERNVRGRLKTMDPDKAEAMKKQMRAVGLNV